MKALILCFAILGSVVVQAETVVVGGWGTDGMSGASIPQESSVYEAKVVFESLNLPVNQEEKKVIDIGDAVLSCSKPKSGITRLSAGCEVTAMVRGSMALVQGNNLIISERFAEAIYQALKKPMPLGMGQTVKQAGNILCVELVGIRTSYRCEFREIIVNKMKIN